MKIIPLKGGNFSTIKTKDFTLLTNENRDLLKGIKMSVTPFLVVTEKDIILLDAGIGWKNEENITEEIFFEVVGGHTPFMQVFWIRDGQDTVFYGADDLPQESYLKYHLSYKSDFDGRKRWN